MERMGSLKDWTREELVDEMMKQREAMGLRSTTFEERMQICQSAALIALNCYDDQKMIFMSHQQEMNIRMNMLSGF